MRRMVYNMSYVDGKSGNTYVKRFQVFSATRDREYDLMKGGKGKVHYFTANPNGEAEIVTVSLTQASKARKKVFAFDFSALEIKGRGAGGNILTKYSVRKVVFQEEGKSTLGGVDMWYDPIVGRLNREERGSHLGNFNSGNQVVAFYKDGSYETTNFELTNHYDFENIVGIFKLETDAVFNAIHYDGDTKTCFVKRFIIETNTINKHFSIVTEARSSKLIFISKGIQADVEVTYKDGRKHARKKLDLTNLIDIKGWKALGNKLPVQNILRVDLLASEKQAMELETLKATVKVEVEDEETQLGLFGGNGGQ